MYSILSTFNDCCVCSHLASCLSRSSTKLISGPISTRSKVFFFSICSVAMFSYLITMHDWQFRHLIFKLCLSSSPCLYFLFIERSFITCSHICYLLSKSEDRLYVATKFGCWCDTDNKQLVTFRSHSCLEFIEHRTPC